MSRDIRAIAIGATVFRAGITSVTLLPRPFTWLIYAPAVLAGGVTYYIARDTRIYSLLALGCLGAILDGLLSVALTPFGITDFAGSRASFVAAAVSLPFVTCLVLVGGALVGVWQRGWHA